MDMAVMANQARVVRQRFAQMEQRRYGRTWTPEEIALGLVGDVGDLAKLVQGKAGVRAIDDLDAKLAHELADCLWAILTLADGYGVDMAAAFTSTMDELRGWLDRADEDDAEATACGTA